MITNVTDESSDSESDICEQVLINSDTEQSDILDNEKITLSVQEDEFTSSNL